MALIKSTTLPSGVTGEYWKMTHFEANKKNAQIVCSCRLELFKDSSYASGEPIPNTALGFSFVLTSQEIVGNVPSLMYSKIKALNHPKLLGATDG